MSQEKKGCYSNIREEIEDRCKSLIPNLDIYNNNKLFVTTYDQLCKLDWNILRIFVCIQMAVKYYLVKVTNGAEASNDQYYISLDSI